MSRSARRPLLALAHHQLELLAADDRMGGGRRGEHDVGSQQLVGEPVEPDHRAAEALGETQRPVGMAVGDEDSVGATVRESACRELARLAGAQDDDMALLKRAEDAERQVDRYRRYAHPVRADPGLRAHALAGRQGGGEQAV